MISIIIPVYNVEKYLDQCIESILRQTHSNWECILVNDGSTDNSGNICNRWASKDNRIHIIHQENKGVSIARNTGIRICKGEYICFIDADDWIEKEYLDTMYKHINNSDIVISGIIRNFPNNKTFEQKPLKTENFTLEYDNIYKFVDLNNKSLLFAPHEKLYRSKIIKENNIKFVENCSYGEDLIFNYQYLQFVYNIFTISTALYHYRILTNSLSTKLRYNQFEEDYHQWRILKEFHAHRNLENKVSLDYLYKKLWGIVYDGIFLYPHLNPKPEKYIKKILEIPEIKELINYKHTYPCSIWIKQAIINKYIFIFNLYFKIFNLI